MAAGLANHAWSIAELLMEGIEFRIDKYDNEDDLYHEYA
jgi:hypothetical protein